MPAKRRKKRRTNTIVTYGGRYGMPFVPYAPVPGPGMSMCTAADCGVAQAGCDCGGGCCGESDDRGTEFGTMLEGLILENPDSQALKEIKDAFNGLSMDEPIYDEYYDDGESVDEDEEEMISALAAACEATLSAFKRATGMDYMDFRR